jgi:FkbM family methyltransferase
MSVKEAVIQGMRTVSPLTAPFFDTLLAWSQKYRELRFLLPAGKQFVYDQYLGKFQVNIDTTFPIEAEMATGRYDLKTSAVLQKCITADATVLDIGANVGALTLLMASLTPQGRVVAIEPGPSTFARLQANVELNSQLSKRVDIYQLGIADQPGVLYWQEDANVPGNAGLLSQEGVEVKVEALDDFIPQLALDRLDFIKIDVEGMEYEVIKGGLDTIAQYRPILYYETSGKLSRQSRLRYVQPDFPAIARPGLSSVCDRPPSSHHRSCQPRHLALSQYPGDPRRAGAHEGIGGKIRFR